MAATPIRYQPNSSRPCRLQVADQPAHRDDRGDERDDEADERVHARRTCRSAPAVLQRLERGGRARASARPSRKLNSTRGRHRDAERQRGEDRDEAAARARPQREDLRGADDDGASRTVIVLERRRAGRSLAAVARPSTRITTPPTIHATITGHDAEQVILDRASRARRRRRPRERTRSASATSSAPAVGVAADEPATPSTSSAAQ